jgi:probable F420-dependent oxidoreductase
VALQRSKKGEAIVQVGVTMRNMGPESTRAMMADCARAAEECGAESVWITDHVAIPPDDAEGSGGRYVDPLITLGWLAGITRTIKLGSGVIVLPYRPPLMFARQVAALQELSGGRLLLGVGIGWMEAEFRALGIERSDRGRDSDAVLAFLDACFAADVVEANGQPFLFKPRPAKPPVLVGGRAPHALERAARYGDGWLPMGMSPKDIVAAKKSYLELTERYGKSPGTITLMTSVALNDTARARDELDAYAAAGVDRVVCAVRYRTYTEYASAMQRLATVLSR